MATTEITVSKDESAENLNHESNKVCATNEERVTQMGGTEAHERVHAKKDDDVTVTTAAKSLGDPNACESVCEEKYFTAVVNGILFKGSVGPSHSVKSCELDGGNDICFGAEETLKERNKRLLANERERLKQRKVKIPKQKGKYGNCEGNSQSIKVKTSPVVDIRDNERTITRAQQVTEQREISSVDRRWEIELVSRMRDKIRTKVEKRGKTTVKRVVWRRIRYFPKVFTYAIRMFSSSAFRFAAFKSNRSYIPGD